jgi:hypothetical protein
MRMGREGGSKFHRGSPSDCDAVERSREGRYCWRARKRRSPGCGAGVDGRGGSR